MGCTGMARSFLEVVKREADQGLVHWERAELALPEIMEPMRSAGRTRQDTPGSDASWTVSVATLASLSRADAWPQILFTRET